VKPKANGSGFDFKSETIKFSLSEFITNVSVYSDDLTKKITAINIKTDKKNYTIGKPSNILRSEVIARKDYFISEFRTT
jgi:hypothetical protein